MINDYQRMKLAEARAMLTSTRAALCPHGVRWRDCKQHDDEPPVMRDCCDSYPNKPHNRYCEGDT